MLATAVGLSVLVGVALGMLGGGGSILTMPILLYVLHLDQKDAIATSLVVVGVTSLVAMIPHVWNKRVDLKIGLLFAATGAMGAYGGGWVARYLPGNWLMGGFVGMMALAGVAMLRKRKEEAAGRVAVGRVLGAGLGSGMVTGLVGAGGGFIVVPALTLFGGLEMRTAVGTSLLVITLNTLAGYLGHASQEQVPFSTIAAITGAAVAGSILGSAFSNRVPQATLKKAFGLFVIAMSVYMAIRQFS